MTTLEPLRGKGIKLGENLQDVYLKMDVKSAVEFFKYYKGNIKKLPNDLYTIYNSICKREIEEYEYVKTDYIDWLFDYCFWDVVE